MAQGPRFFTRNRMDISFAENFSIAVVDAIAADTGESFADLVCNRNNRSGWATTDSTDAAGTTFTVTWLDEVDISRIFLVMMNFKAFTIKYWDGAAYQDFSTPVNETVNMQPTKLFSFDKVTTTRIQITITGTQSANDDKFLRQLICCEEYGQFVTGFQLDNVTMGQARKVSTVLSGKSKITRNVGAFMCTFKKNNVTQGNDITLIETLYGVPDGFLVWLCGGDVSQFRTLNAGYRMEDIFLCDFSTEYNPDWNKGHYDFGVDINFKINEIA